MRVFMYIAGAYLVLALVASYRAGKTMNEKYGVTNLDDFGVVLKRALGSLTAPVWVVRTALQGMDPAMLPASMATDATAAGTGAQGDRPQGQPPVTPKVSGTMPLLGQLGGSSMRTSTTAGRDYLRLKANVH